MRDAGDLVTREQGRMQAGRAAPPERATSLSERDIDALWLRMAQMYGYRWSRSYGKADRGGMWRKGLDGLTTADLAVGLQACMDAALEWPPTLPQFRALCRPPRQRRENEAMYREARLALPPPADPVIARRNLAAIRERIGAAPPTTQPSAPAFASDPERRAALEAELDRLKAEARAGDP